MSTRGLRRRDEHTYTRRQLGSRGQLHVKAPASVRVRSLAFLCVIQALYQKATRLELDGNFDAAFKLYIKAAGEYIRLSRLSQDPASREQHKADAGKALQRAEKIKLRKQDQITPVAKDHFLEGKYAPTYWIVLIVRLCTGEQLFVLQRSSVVHGVRYSLWVDESLSDQ